MTEPQTENGQQAANRYHDRMNNTQRIRYVRVTMAIDGKRRHILEPTTVHERTRVLPDSSPYLAQRI